jgi:hypothetical protein
MPSIVKRESAIARILFAFGLATFLTGLALAIAAAAQANSTPVGPLPPGPTSTTTTAPGQLVAIALPRAPRRSGLVWRIARRYDSRIVHQTTEADVGANVVLVFRVVGRGHTALVFALTRGDTSPNAVNSATHKIRSL